MTALSIQNLRKEFGDLVAVDDVSVQVKEGELLCLLGPSGCGKSTTLRMIAGLETPTDGRILFGDDDVTDEPSYNRDSSMVFQSWALFPTKTVLENVAFGLKMDGMDVDERHERARETLEWMEMTAYEDAKPDELSGGQQQRVALARSLTVSPELLLLDEPLSNLDKQLRELMQIELKGIHDRLETTMIHVTHDQDEAFTLADRIGIMNDGELIQIGTPREVYSDPANQFVEEFLGETNMLAGTYRDSGAEAPMVELDGNVSIPLGSSLSSLDAGERTYLSLRPEVLSLAKPESEPTGEQELCADGTGTRQRITGVVQNILYRGSMVRYYVEVGDVELFAEQRAGTHESFDEGEPIELAWDRSQLLYFDEAGTRVR